MQQELGGLNITRRRAQSEILQPEKSALLVPRNRKYPLSLFPPRSEARLTLAPAQRIAHWIICGKKNKPAVKRFKHIVFIGKTVLGPPKKTQTKTY